MALLTPLFESLVTDLLLQKPENPHAFLLASLSAMSPQAIQELKYVADPKAPKFNLPKSLTPNSPEKVVVVTVAL